MRVPLKIITQEIVDAYNLSTLVDNQGWIYMCIEKGLHGLKQAGIIANQEFMKHMAPFGYHPVQHTPVLWVHDIRNTIFSLVVGDFFVQYSLMEDAEHFLNALRAKYLITVDMEVTVYDGMNLDWDYMNRTVTFSIPNCVRKYLHRFQYILMGGKDYPPHICAPIKYGQKIQYTDPLDAVEYLSDKETNLIQQVCGHFLYYAIAINNTILPYLSDISSDQSKATKNTAKQVANLLNYLASNPNAEIQYRASGMQ